MERRYGGPLGRLARLLLWEAGEITLEASEREHLLNQTWAKLIALRALHQETSNNGTVQTTQQRLPWE